MKKSKNEKLEVYSVIGFSIMMWFISIILIFLGVSLLKGNYSSVHGKVLDTTNDKEGYAKELGKPTLLIGIGLFISGIIAVILPHDFYYCCSWISIIYSCYFRNMVL